MSHLHNHELCLALMTTLPVFRQIIWLQCQQLGQQWSLDTVILTLRRRTTLSQPLDRLLPNSSTVN